jgi:heat shock protein HslJ
LTSSASVAPPAPDKSRNLLVALTSVGLLALGATGAWAAEKPPFEGAWRIVAIHDAPAFDAAKTEFNAGPDGHVGSTIGCNRVIGSPKLDGDKITFEAMGATMMACPPPLDAVERAYLTALEAVRAFTLEGDALAFVGGDGAVLIKLERRR